MIDFPFLKSTFVLKKSSDFKCWPEDDIFFLKY
jgi:hypothetical protein